MLLERKLVSNVRGERRAFVHGHEDFESVLCHDQTMWHALVPMPPGISCQQEFFNIGLITP